MPLEINLYQGNISPDQRTALLQDHLYLQSQVVLTCYGILKAIADVTTIDGRNEYAVAAAKRMVDAFPAR